MKVKFPLNDVMHLAEVMSGSMHDFLSTVQPTVTEELTLIAKEISRMKQEISQLRANDHDPAIEFLMQAVN